MKKLGEFFKEFFKLIKLETMTMPGRVNLVSLALLVLFVIIYTTNDMMCYLISAVRDAFKTCVLKTNISESYETVSVFKVMIPIIILIIFCFGYLLIDEKKKKEIDVFEEKER